MLHYKLFTIICLVTCLNYYYIKFSIASITNSFKHLKGDKASGVDGLAAEHFLYANRHIYVYLSLLFNSFCITAIYKQNS